MKVGPMVHLWAQRGLETHVYRVAFWPSYLRLRHGTA